MAAALTQWTYTQGAAQLQLCFSLPLGRQTVRLGRACLGSLQLHEVETVLLPDIGKASSSLRVLCKSPLPYQQCHQNAAVLWGFGWSGVGGKASSSVP